LLCNRRISKLPFPGNGSVNTPTTIEELLKAVFPVVSAPRIYNENPRVAERVTEKRRVSSSVVMKRVARMRL
jgi:hypothetical protein